MPKTTHSPNLRAYQTVTVDGGQVPDQLRLLDFRVSHRRERISGQWVEYRVKNLVVTAEYLAAPTLVNRDFNTLLRTTNLGTIPSRVVRADGGMDTIYYKGPWRVADLDSQVTDSIVRIVLSLVWDESDGLRNITYSSVDSGEGEAEA